MYGEQFDREYALWKEDEDSSPHFRRKAARAHQHALGIQRAALARENDGGPSFQSSAPLRYSQDMLPGMQGYYAPRPLR